jgi:hypothetical protein
MHLKAPFILFLNTMTIESLWIDGNFGNQAKNTSSKGWHGHASLALAKDDSYV